MTKPLNIRQYFAFTSLAAPFALMQGPGLAILPNMYAEHFGIALTEISVALLISRLIFDSLGSLVIGLISDYTHTRWGRRKPWIVAGTALGLLGIFQLYSPTGRPDVWHLGIWMCIVYVAWNMFDVPYSAWANELTRDYLERSKLAIWRQSFNVAGILIMAWLPLIVSPTGEVDWTVLHWVSYISLVILPIAVCCSIWQVPKGEELKTKKSLGWKLSIATIAGNRPFMLFLLYTVVQQLAIGISGTLFFLFYTNYLGLGNWFPFFTTSTIAVSLLSMPVWMAVLKRTSKNFLLMLGALGFTVGLPFIYWMEPGPNALYIYAIYDAMWMLFYGAVEVGSRSLLGDIIDYDTLKTGNERSGEYVAIWTFTSRTTLAVAASIAFAIAGSYGYEPSAAQNDAHAIFGLKLTMGGLPATISLFAAGLVLLLPMTRARHEIIRRRLERRTTR